MARHISMETPGNQLEGREIWFHIEKAARCQLGVGGWVTSPKEVEDQAEIQECGSG